MPGVHDAWVRGDVCVCGAPHAGHVGVSVSRRPWHRGIRRRLGPRHHQHHQRASAPRIHQVPRPRELLNHVAYFFCKPCNGDQFPARASIGLRACWHEHQRIHVHILSLSRTTLRRMLPYLHDCNTHQARCCTSPYHPSPHRLSGMYVETWGGWTSESLTSIREFLAIAAPSAGPSSGLA